MAVYQVMLYSKKVKANNGNTFPQWLVKIPSKKTLQAQLSNDFKTKLGMCTCTQPYLLTVDDEDYFLKDVRYENSKGETRTKTVMVLLSARRIEQAVFEKRTIDSLIDKAVSNDEEIEQYLDGKDLPF